jgi:hypothetical protein
VKTVVLDQNLTEPPANGEALLHLNRWQDLRAKTTEKNHSHTLNLLTSSFNGVGQKAAGG